MKITLFILLSFCISMTAAQPSSSRSISGTDVLRNSLGSAPGATSGSANEGEGGGGEEKSLGTAILYSLALPGMGELYAGDYSSGKYFTIAEGAGWITLIAFDRYASWVQSDARSFAVQHAGVTISGQGDQFYANIGDYADVQSYNIEMLRERDAFSLYNERSVYSWKWDTPQNLQSYRDQRILSDTWFNNTRFVVAAILANHVISAINAARLTISANNRHAESGSLDIHAGVTGNPLKPDGICLSFTRTF